MKKSYLLILAFLCSGIISVRAQINDIFPFNGTNGANPYGSLVLSGKVLYGTTSYGGSHNDGTVFAIDTNGTHFKQLVDFYGADSAVIKANSADSALGLRPYGSLVLSGNRLYGMTTIGGRDGEGVIFSVDTGGRNYKDLFDFSPLNGTVPEGSLTLIGSTLYGMTLGGGSTGTGVIFRIDTLGKNYTVLFDFNGTTGASAHGTLTLVGNKFYGMTESGGTNRDGNVFSIDTSGATLSYKDVLDFNGQSSPYGSLPVGDVTYINGKLYGMTQEGGANNKGVIFSVDTSGNNYKDMLDFDGTNGYSGEADFVVVGDTILYGMTQAGGAHADGNIFSIDTSGKIFTDLIDFDGANGSFLNGSLILANNEFFGTAYDGGINGKGTIFSNHLNLSVATVVKSVSQPVTLTVYPNPNNGYFTIEGITQGQVIELYDYTGEMLNSAVADNTRMRFDISDKAKANGIYLVRILNKDGSVVTEQMTVKIQ